MEEARRHDRMRLYIHERDGRRLFGDLRRPLPRAPGRRTARKAIAIGGFAVGTFGLGFTLGGLIFGRWRKA
jgi:hypothetical protein